jgi:hypothetical protein
VRTRLLTSLVAAFMAIVIGVGGTARPARAVVPWMTIAISVATSLFFGGGSGDLEQAKREIIAAINASRQEMLDHIDAIASADVRACTESATTLVAQIDLMDQFTLAAFVINAVDCATLSTAYFDAVQNLGAADNIGKLMGMIYSIAMVGFAKLGFPTVDLLDGLIRGYEAVVTKLAPVCVEFPDREPGTDITVINYECTAYNGDKGYGIQIFRSGRPTWPFLDRVYVQNEATRNTSRAVAQSALPTLRQLRAALP